MVEFKQLREGMLASPQIEAGDVARAKEAGVTLIINNRPDGEAGDQPAGAEIEAAAQANGIAYRAIPVSSAGFSLPQIEEMQAALDEADGTVLAFCRSGTRSTILWALAKAKSGAPVDQLSDDALAAGYDVSGIRPTMEMLSRQSGS
ncbi:TIGR01244 family phosphatase [Qipengyuania sp. GH1]|uniref:TIGR01244 family sulfur transferase n=1 Tax=Qipengyuania aestuarii TaxID=2867241 RepID=UPI001C86CF7D|nr:TIGR01244 family sulfur transferase [Qipengyuania aestuarii]MBX7536441.1 TIGR01244 family phosphatase [Qipengyuania aestuarii]